MKALLLAAGLALATAPVALADHQTELSAPITTLTMVIADNADLLDLTAAQRDELAVMLDVYPSQFANLDARMIKARDELRRAIIRGSTVKKRSVLSARLGKIEAKRIMVRSVAADQWREILTREQFAKAVELAEAERTKAHTTEHQAQPDG